MASGPSTSSSPRNEEDTRIPMKTEENIQYFKGFQNPNCVDVSEKYHFIDEISGGGFGIVYLCKLRESSGPQSLLAIKEINLNNQDELNGPEYHHVSNAVLREVRILKSLQHENIVKLIEVCTKKDQFREDEEFVYLVMEYCMYDLNDFLMQNKLNIKLREKKEIVKQFMNGILFMHEKRIMHRDLKPHNILITQEGIVKIGDFGLARPHFSPEDRPTASYTSQVGTVCYQSPEMLLGSRVYGPATDIWSSGCIMADLWLRDERPLFQGKTQQAIIKQILQFCGAITPENWPDAEHLPLFRNLVLTLPKKVHILSEKCEDTLGKDLIDKLLVYDRSKRLDADKILDHDFLWTGQMPCDLKEMISRYQGIFKRQGMYSVSRHSVV